MTRLLDAAVAVVDAQHATLGHACTRAATALERAAELLRWVAAATRVCP